MVFLILLVEEKKRKKKKECVVEKRARVELVATQLSPHSPHGPHVPLVSLLFTTFFFFLWFGPNHHSLRAFVDFPLFCKYKHIKQIVDASQFTSNKRTDLPYSHLKNYNWTFW